MNFNEIFWKTVNMMILKVTKKQTFTTSSDSIVFQIYLFVGLSCGFLLNESSILVFAELTIFHSI